MLGDLFEQLLNKGFKQNEGQFFTPIPITRFIWDSLPIEKIIKKADGIEFPKIIDYACGAGHFLTQGFEAINSSVLAIEPSYIIDRRWAEHSIYGVEKDYRLARVSKISLFMHGAGDGNIIFGDGLENYPDKGIVPNTFDILVANPPYSVKAFKPHLKLKDNEFAILDKISNNGSEIETLFVERISQLIKPKGIVAVILPVAILNKDSNSFISSREEILKNFKIKAIVHLGKNTFGETGQPTVILFLEKYNAPPKRIDLVSDSVSAILEGQDLHDWEDDEILKGYLEKICVDITTYDTFIKRANHFTYWKSDEYFSMYYDQFITSSEYTTKLTQKNFIKLSDDEKIAWFNQHFYDYALLCESEKLSYFALVYKQKVAIVTAPDDKKKEEVFLGYKWNGRKGQEGIQTLNSGGLLYNPIGKKSDDKLCSIIKNFFSDNETEIPELKEYYYYLRLQDMLDFTTTNFTKAIKTAKTRELKNTPGLVNYKLSDKKWFDLSIGNRVLSTEVEPTGAFPIYSANVYEEFGRINKQNITDFTVPSVIWGIDGDWMVNYIEQAHPFYATDHCGVLRINNPNIIPHYFALALQVEGEYEKFSRSNRASTQRIKNLIIQIPDKKTQEKILTMLQNFSEDIHYDRMTISDIDKKSRQILLDYLGDICSEDNVLEKLLRIVKKH